MVERGYVPSGELENQLMLWANDHATASDGRFVSFGYNPEVYPGQSGVSVQGSSLGYPVIDLYAKDVLDVYPNLLDSLDAQEDDTEIISTIGELLRGGNNVILATNHGDLMDIAIAHAAFYSRLNNAGYNGVAPLTEKGKRDFKTALIASKMISFLGLVSNEDKSIVTPTTAVLNMLEEQLYLSYPRTTTSHKRGILSIKKSEVDRHNDDMRNALTKFLGTGSVLLAMAASGSTDKPLPDDPETIGLGKLGQGTIKIFQTLGTYVVPVAVYYEGADPFIEICDIPRIIRSDNEAENVMQKIATRLTSRVSDKYYEYQK